MTRGFLLDCYVDEKKDRLITWILQDNHNVVRHESRYQPSFFVKPPHHELFSLASKLHQLNEIKHINITEKPLQLGSKKPTQVLEITPQRLTDIRRLATLIDTWGKHHRYQLFDVDLRTESRFLANNNVFFNAKIQTDSHKKLCVDHDTQWSIDYQAPPWKILHLDVEIPHITPLLDQPLKRLQINNQTLELGSEEDNLKELQKIISQKDPDIIITSGGDSFTFPYLYARAQHVGIHKKFTLHRERGVTRKRAIKKEKSYMSYGHIVYRPAFHTLKGRIHLDKSSSFFYKESNLEGLLDISRCANLSLQLLSRLGPGTAISQMQINHAQKLGYPTPWKKAQTETCKTALELLQTDRGGHILSPRVGFHSNVAELDFASLYPNIMVKYNISPETMLCSCCSPTNAILVPQIGYHICTKQKGLLPSVLQPILTRRFCYKARMKHPGYDTQKNQCLQNAWKWILVVCFGYTGYKNSRYGRIECHESITAYARTHLLNAMHIAERCGYNVLHGIVDSLWIQPQQNQTSQFLPLEKVARTISRELCIKIKEAGRYKWIVFVKSKGLDVGALTRYYGVFEDGSIKARGIELRQRNTPLFFKTLQHDILSLMSKATTKEEIHALLPNILDFVCKKAQHIISDNVSLDQLLLTTSVSRHPADYKVNTCVHDALLQAQHLGFNISPGQNIRYVVCDNSSKDPMKRVKIQEALHTNETILIDKDFYLRWLLRSVESLLLPFGYTQKQLIKKTGILHKK